MRHFLLTEVLPRLTGVALAVIGIVIYEYWTKRRRRKS